MTDSQWVDPVLQVADAMSRVPDEAMEGFVTWVGVDAVLDGVFAEICRRFQAEKAGSNTAVVQWEIATADGPVIFQLHISDGTCRAVRGADELPQLTIGLHLTDFLRSLVGQLDTTEAFLTGRVRLDGDLLLAQSMATWFGDGPWAEAVASG